MRRALLERHPLARVQGHALVQEIGEVDDGVLLVLRAFAPHDVALDGSGRGCYRHQSHRRLSCKQRGLPRVPKNFEGFRRGHGETRVKPRAVKIVKPIAVLT